MSLFVAGGPRMSNEKPYYNLQSRKTPRDVSIAQPGLDNSSIKTSSQMILVKTNQHND